MRDTLQAVTDTVALRERERLLLQWARRAGNDPAFHVQLGHVALRQGELGGASHLDDAAAEFRLAARLAPQWPYAWLGLGYAEYTLGGRLGGGSSGDRRAELARDAFSRAAQAFARAVTLEPGFAPRLEELARRATREASGEKARVLRDALRRATSGSGPPPRSGRLLLALGRVERELTDPAALRTFAGYLATNQNRALGLVELGRAQLLQGDLSGAARYLAGAADDDPVAAVEYRADLMPIASDSELVEFDRRRGPGRAEFLRRFWTTRDRLELRQDGERLAEHLRRLVVARREFLVVMSDSTERLDDRGRIYVRHGDPDDRASFLVPGVEPNESWRYGRDLVLHFVSRQAPSDYRLVESVLDVPDARRGFPNGGSADPLPAPVAQSLRSGTEQIFRSRSALSPVYRQVPASRPDQVADFLSRERALGRRGIRVGTRSDSYRLHFTPDLNAWGAVLVAGGVGALPTLQVVFAIPGYAVEPASGTVGVVYPVRVRFIAIDSMGNVIASVDSISRITLGGPVPPNRSLVGRIAVPVRPGRLYVHAAVQYGDRAGSEFGIDTILVPSPGGGQLAAGDLLVGSDRSRILLPLGDGAEFHLAPGGVVRRSEGLGLALDVFGLEPGARANVRVLLAEREEVRPAEESPLRWRTFPHRQTLPSLARAPGAGPIVPWRVSLPLNGLSAGSYWLAVVVTDETGKMVRRETRLEIEAP